MAYIRYKEVTKHFNLTKVLDKNNLPYYVTDYVCDGEILLAAYQVGRDHGIITDKKIVLFDDSNLFGIRKKITSIPYKSVTAHSIIFYKTRAELYLLLESGHPLLLKFSNLDCKDKVRLRLLYNAMSASICNLKISNEVIDRLLNNKLDYDK
jgi:hypothetical protein